MADPDLNLLVTLDVLLAEGSVAGAARRLRLSPSAMSRSLARLREAMHDPLLVRAGRGLVPTPRAAALREHVGHLLRDVRAVLGPAEATDVGGLVRTFTLRTSEGFVENFGPALLARVRRESPGVRLHFVPKPDRDSAPLRDGSVDLETGVIARASAPELRVQALFRDRFVGVVRDGHPLVRSRVTVGRYASASHALVSRSGQADTPVDRALQRAGRARDIATLVGGFATALAVARATDLVATVPERHTGLLRVGMQTFALPFVVPPITVSMLWHPRLHADAGHRWLRACVREVCAAAAGEQAGESVGGKADEIAGEKAAPA